MRKEVIVPIGYIRKIKDLLALSESPNEHEARAALLKARELMVKYKVSELDITDVRDRPVVKKHTGVTYSVRRDPWVSYLATVIAEHHCCRDFMFRKKKKQTIEVGLLGFSGDVEICMQVFSYAVECVRLVTEKYRKKSSADVANGYGFGFVRGLMDAYEKQQAEKESEEGWALVVMTPKEVEEADRSFKRTKSGDVSGRVENADRRAFGKGMEDGSRFGMVKRIREGGNTV